jgi:uncharacterized protein (UPF0548 family)
MFLLGSKTENRVRQILERHKASKLSYEGVGRTQTLLPGGCEVHRGQFLLGEGSHVFYKAKEAVQLWRMFDIPWVRLYRENVPLNAGNTVAILAGGFGVWMVNLCRVIYVIDEPRRYGFAYGTLPEHAEAGEERFLVEWRDDNLVWYEVLAFSHEQQLLAKLAYPIARRLQKKFRNDSGLAMQKASAVLTTGALRTP